MPVNPELANENWLRYQYMRDRSHIDFLSKADRCEQFFRGDQWEQSDLDSLKLQKRPALTINKILSTIGTIAGEQINNRAEVLFRPRNGSPAEVAEALTKVWMQIAQNNQLQWTRSDVFLDGLIRSRGFYDVRMDFADAMQGEVRITPMNSKNVVVDPDADEYDPDFWNDVIVTKWLSGQDIAMLFNEDDGDYLSKRDGSYFPYGFDSIERTRDRFGGLMPLAGYYDAMDKNKLHRNIRVLDRQYRKLDKQLHFVDVENGDMRPVPQDWDRNRIAALLEKTAGKLSTTKKLVKRIRWTVTADNVVLHDEWSPYKHFTVVPYFPHFRYGRTIGLVENLLGPQELLNKVSSQELHVVNTTANSGWAIEGGSLLNMSIEELEQKGAQTGLVLEYAKGAQPPSKIQPNQTPTGLDRISYKAEEHIKTISNVSDSMQGFDREDVAAKAIQYKGQRGAVNLAKVLDNLQRTDFILARNVLDLVQAYYTEPRIVSIINADASHESEQVQVNQPDPVSGEIVNDLTLGEYDIIISSTPARDSMEDSQFEQVMAMRQQGVQIPDAIVIEASRLMRKADIIKQMSGDKESPEAQAQMQLQQRGQEAEVAKLEAEAQQKGADAQLKMSKAQVEGSDGGQMQQMQIDFQKMQTELAMKERELQLKEAEMQMKLELKQREHEQNMAITQQKAAHDASLKEQDSAARRVQMLRQSSNKPSETPLGENSEPQV